MESAREQINNWSSFSQTMATTIAIFAGLNLTYLLLQRVSTRLDTIAVSASPAQDVVTFLQAAFFFALIPTMLLIRYRINNPSGYQFQFFGFLQRDLRQVAIFLGSISGILVFLCVRFTIQSILLN